MAFVDWLSLALRPAPIATLTVIGGLARAQILQSLTDLQIADALATRHKTAAELSAELGRDDIWVLPSFMFCGACT